MQYFGYSKSLTGHKYTLHGSENMKLHYGMEKWESILSDGYSL